MIGLIVLWLGMAAGQGQTTICEPPSQWSDIFHGCVVARTWAPEPIDVPAVQKWRKVRHWPSSGDGTVVVTIIPPEVDEPYWDCLDHRRVLLESVDGSVAVCHKITEEK